MKSVIASLKHGLIVSCQAEGDDPFNRPEYLALFARAAEMGGAVGIRACGVENVRAIKAAVNLPVIGITKSKYADGSVLITPDRASLEALVETGADIVAMDVTDRPRPDGASALELLQWAVASLPVPVMADIATLAEGLAAAAIGADLVSTTLSGYTPATAPPADPLQPDLNLVHALATQLAGVPVVAEGRIYTPQMAAQAMKAGAFAVVVGTALTRPRVMTQYYVKAICAKNTLDTD